MCKCINSKKHKICNFWLPKRYATEHVHAFARYTLPLNATRWGDNIQASLQRLQSVPMFRMCHVMSYYVISCHAQFIYPCENFCMPAGYKTWNQTVVKAQTLCQDKINHLEGKHDQQYISALLFGHCFHLNKNVLFICTSSMFAYRRSEDWTILWPPQGTLGQTLQPFLRDRHSCTCHRRWDRSSLDQKDHAEKDHNNTKLIPTNSC